MSRAASLWLGTSGQFHQDQPDEARKYLVKNTLTPPDVADTVPMIRYYMVKDLTAKDIADFQKFIDFSVKTGTLPEKVEVSKYLEGVLVAVTELQRTDTSAAETGAAAAVPAHVTIRGLTKRFGKASIYELFDFDIPRGKLVSIFGPNGCGKSTLINMIAGLIPSRRREILFARQAAERNQVRLCFSELSRSAVSVDARVRQH